MSLWICPQCHELTAPGPSICNHCGKPTEFADMTQPKANAGPGDPARLAAIPHCQECGCQTGGGDFCYQHKPYTVTPKKDGSFVVDRLGVSASGLTIRHYRRKNSPHGTPGSAP